MRWMSAANGLFLPGDLAAESVLSLILIFSLDWGSMNIKNIPIFPT